MLLICLPVCTHTNTEPMYLIQTDLDFKLDRLKNLLKILDTMETKYDPIERVWSGPTNDSPHHPHSSAGKIFENAAKQNVDRVAQIFEPTGEKMTFKEIHQMSMKIANHLNKLNVSQKDVVGICASNAPYLASVVFGSFLAAIPVSTLDPSFDKDGIKHTFGTTKPKVMFCDQNIVDRVKEAFNDLNLECLIYSVDGKGEGSVEGLLLKSPNDQFE